VSSTKVDKVYLEFQSDASIERPEPSQCNQSSQKDIQHQSLTSPALEIDIRCDSKVVLLHQRYTRPKVRCTTIPVHLGVISSPEDLENPSVHVQPTRADLECLRELSRFRLIIRNGIGTGSF
jgi:hypothetical protein